MTRRKESFAPIDASNVRLYVCGPTVYNFAHIGNGRTFVVFDQLYRVLRRHYGAGHVNYVRNITDIDDRIIDTARANGETIADLTRRTVAAFQQDMASLGCLPPNIEPEATAHVEGMIAMIAQLIETGHAYLAEGHVLFAVGSLPSYGALSHRSLDDMLAGARVEVAPYKREAGDFVLWKPSTAEQPGWDSPWGRGRPGWHIECSAMCEEHLGEHFDIHGGGLDLIFPHHENEIAQSVAAHRGGAFVNIWMHAAFLDFGGEKMSKSLGNIQTPHDLLKSHPGEVLRWALLSGHYRDPMEWNEDRLQQSRASLDRFYLALRAVAEIEAIEDDGADVIAALDDDLNTPLAQTILHELTGALNKATDDDEKARLKGRLLASGQLMGVLMQTPETWFRWTAESNIGPDDATIDDWVEQRRAARVSRNFAEADRLRKALTDAGILMEDGPQGTVWRRG